MKKVIFLILLISSGIVNAQSLKDALYGGKLKTDSGTLIRKGDDLKSKIDTSSKKPVEPEKMKVSAPGTDTSMKGVEAQTATTAIPDADRKNSTDATKDNNRIWKEYMDSVISGLKTEVLSSKKIKEGNYFILVEYEIDTTGQVNINRVSPSPENDFLELQVRERLILTAPRLNPVIFNNGKPRKVTKKYSFTLSKL